MKENPEAKKKPAGVGTKQEEPRAQGSLGGRLGEMTMGKLPEDGKSH